MHFRYSKFKLNKMKTLLSIIVYDTDEKHTSTLYDGIELIYPEDKENEKDFVSRAIKNAKGKYAVLLQQRFRLADVNSLLNILDKNSPDMIVFAGGTALKASVVKNVVKDCQDLFSCFILSVLSCKTVLKSVYIPFNYIKGEVNFTEENYSGLLVASEAFGEAKASLTKDIYSHAMNALCARLVSYYLYAMVCISEGSMEREKLISFDNSLKAEIVLYLTLEKNFTYAKLAKLRKKGFKISWLTAKKFVKQLSAQ